MTEANEYKHEVDYATYDPEDDKLRIYSGRVSKELYDILAEAGYRRAYKQGCFFATWQPRREDLALELCGEIEDEDSTLLDRAGERQERFATYSDNAARRARQRHQASHDAVKGIPLGQPILVGHHSERAHRAAIKRAQNHATKAVEESRRRDYWSRRAKSALRNANRKAAPGPTARRIKKLKAELRKCQRMIDPQGKDWHDAESWSRSFHKKTDDEIAQMWEQRVAYYSRWIEHLEGQVEYWETIYTESGGVNADRHGWDLKKGGWVRGRWGWGQVQRVNKGQDGEISSVSLDKETFKTRGGWMPRIVKYPEIAAYMQAWDEARMLRIENALATGEPLPTE
jgi:hypothetical protein